MRSGSRVLSSISAAGNRVPVIEADYPRLVVTYSARDDIVCVLRPPGAEPRTVLGVARLVLDDELYRELAGYLGVTPSWDVGRESMLAISRSRSCPPAPLRGGAVSS
jgi:hypothetical protein